MNEPGYRSTTADTGHSLLSLLLLGIGIIVAIIVARLGRAILMPLFAAIVLAALMTAVVNSLKKRFKLKAGVAFGLLVRGSFVVVALAVWLLDPSVMDQFSRSAY